MMFVVHGLINALRDIAVDIAAAACGRIISKLATWRC